MNNVLEQLHNDDVICRSPIGHGWLVENQQQLAATGMSNHVQLQQPLRQNLKADPRWPIQSSACM